MSFDIKTAAVTPTSTFQLRDAADLPLFTTDSAGDKVPVTVTVYGPGSKEYQRAQTRVSNRMLKRMQQKGRAEQTPEDKSKEQAEYLTEITDGFGNLSYDGLTGRALSMAVYSDPSIGFIGDQVAEHVREWTNFSAASSKT